AGGVFDWTPTFDDAGVYTATITVTDGLLTDEETITITVTNVNRAPVLSPVGDKVTNEEQLLQFNVIASDPDGDAVTISMVASTLPPAATFDGAQFSWTPVIGDAGIYDVEFVATDGNLEDAETIQITVNSANQPPYFEDPIPEFSVSEGETIVWLLHAFDANSDNLTMWLDPVLSNMSFVDLGDGTLEITFSPNCSQSGGYELSAFVADGEFTVSVDINFVVIEACDPTEIGIAIIEPDPIKYLYAQLIDQINAVIYFGNLSGGFTIADVNLGSLMVNGFAPIAVTVEPSHPMFSGEVLKIEVSMIDFVHSYPALYDTTLQTFSLTGLFNDKCTPIDVHGEFTFIGKLRGDVNLDGSVDINDLTYMVSYFFHDGRPPIDYGTADMDDNGSVGISDLTELINYIF
ncbi:MAG: Ig-like domain-containing protein, partial [candidate division Zixibacteria bacterium]|nr:Ig-like domain-containing protein [candidate division Zixibacteria bacterium]